MDPYHLFMNELINKNEGSFRMFPGLKWLNPYEAINFEEERNAIINSFSNKVKWLFKNTKPYINSISPGCKLCGEGEWSCLFITGKCNANCFYCPAPQTNDDLPTAQTLKFGNPDDYAALINEYNYKGCSFSGGEPLLVFDRLTSFLSAIRTKCPPNLYIWMYTNGILASKDKFKQLGDLGLNEARFDIGATNYDISAIKKASPYIKNLTVEIPAVPYRYDHYLKLLKKLIDVGVTNLNLHQIRLTQHNVRNLKFKPYTYLHGEQPTVVESELTALKVIKIVQENKLNIGVNYCSFQYKNRFQKAGYRNKIARKHLKNYFLSETGYGFRLYHLINGNLPSGGSIDNKQNLKLIDMNEFLSHPHQYTNIIIEITGATLTNNDKIIENLVLNKENGDVFLDKGQAHPVIIVQKEEIPSFVDLIKGKPGPIPDQPKLFELWRYLYIEEGLRNYF